MVWRRLVCFFLASRWRTKYCRNIVEIAFLKIFGARYRQKLSPTPKGSTSTPRITKNHYESLRITKNNHQYRESPRITKKHQKSPMPPAPPLITATDHDDTINSKTRTGCCDKGSSCRCWTSLPRLCGRTPCREGSRPYCLRRTTETPRRQGSISSHLFKHPSVRLKKSKAKGRQNNNNNVVQNNTSGNFDISDPSDVNCLFIIWSLRKGTYLSVIPLH